MYLYTCNMYKYIYLYIYVYIYTISRYSCMGVAESPVCHGPTHPHLLQTFAVGLCVECCSLQLACCADDVSQDALILLQAKTGPPACYERNVFGTQPYIHIHNTYYSLTHPRIHICPYIHMYDCTHVHCQYLCTHTSVHLVMFMHVVCIGNS